MARAFKKRGDSGDINEKKGIFPTAGPSANTASLSLSTGAI